MIAPLPRCIRRPTSYYVLATALSVLISAGACPGRGSDASSDHHVDRVISAFENQQSGFMTTVPGEVVRILPDDEQGSRHQRFIIQITDSHTLLVSHNIDLAPRAPVALGDSLKVRGQYEWNPQGGVIHWTHHDPQGDDEGGWVRYRRKVYG